MTDRNTEKYYLEGACPYFALALHRIFGYEIKILLSNNIIVHVFVYDKNAGKAIDVRGKLSEEDIKREYHDLIEPIIVCVNDTELKNLMGDDKPLCPYSLEEIMKAMAIIYKDMNIYE